MWVRNICTGKWEFDEDHIPDAWFKPGRSPFNHVEGIYVDHSQTKTQIVIGEGCRRARRLEGAL